jgi:hypothetical protein
MGARGVRTLASAFVTVAVACALAPGAAATAWTASFGVSQYAPSTAEPALATIPMTPPNLGPWSGPISAIAVDPATDSHVLVASEKGGLFESADSGSTWQPEAGLRAALVRDVTFLPVSSLGPGRPCPCAIATVSPFYESSDVGGAYIAYTSGGRLARWRRLAGLEPVSGGCTGAPQGEGISIAPDTHEIYISTSCGLAVGTPQGSFNTSTVPGAPNQNWYSVLALPQRRVILAGSAGVYTFDGTTWSATTSTVGGATGVHSLSADPRPGGRAYYVDDNTNLWETLSQGVSWTQIPAPAPDAGCGGIPNVHAVQPSTLLNAFRLYYGNRCSTYVVAIDDSVEPDAVGTPGWVVLGAGHPDTRDLAFHDGTQEPYFISSDGGIARAVDRTTFVSVGGPDKGLDALETMQVAGQYVGNAALDLYYATWHDFLWATHGTSLIPAGIQFLGRVGARDAADRPAGFIPAADHVHQQPRPPNHRPLLCWRPRAVGAARRRDHLADVPLAGSLRRRGQRWRGTRVGRDPQ